jgi:glutaminase
MSDPDHALVSTGDLPRADLVRHLVDEAHRSLLDVADGQPSDVYPALAAADPDHFGICITGVAGEVYAVGDCLVEFPIMSISKPFTFALVCEALGPEIARERLGVNATGLPFNSLEAVDRTDDGRTNPMVNSGAIATTSLVPGGSDEERWDTIRRGLSAFAGRDLVLDDATFASASATNLRNRAVVQLLDSLGALDHDPAASLDLYTRQCCLAVTARDLAVMGATLADGGVNPITGVPVVSAATCRYVLTVMTIAGLYETTGDWLWEVGLPGKSGIGGGVVAVSPGKGGLAVFSPPLDEAGNSVRGQRVAALLSRQLGLDIFASAARAD